MFDNILEKTEGAITQLSKALSNFENESSVLQAKLNAQISSYQEKIVQDLARLDTLTQEKIDEKALEISQIFDIHNKTLIERTEKNIEDFSKKVKDRFESIYAEYEVAVINKAQNAFETDMVNVFKMYGDKMAPFIFKALLKYIIRFGRKSV